MLGNIENQNQHKTNYYKITQNLKQSINQEATPLFYEI